MKSNKSKTVALILCILGGFLGLHRFYAKRIISGILYLFTMGLFGFGWIYDIFEIIGNRFKDSTGAYIATGMVNPKPAYKKWPFWVAIVVYLIIIFNPSNDKQENSVPTDTDASADLVSSAIIETKDEAAETDTATETDSIINTDRASNTDTETETGSDISTDKPIEYDALQKIFLDFDKDYSIDDITKAIEESGLPYTAEDYNGGSTVYKVAFKEKVTYQSHAEEGNHIEASFDRETGKIRYGEYFDYEAFATSIYYDHGNYWSFSFEDSDNPYAGYYYHCEKDKSLPKTKIMYTNGNSTEVKYSRCDSAENALNGKTIGKDFEPIKAPEKSESSKTESEVSSTVKASASSSASVAQPIEYTFICNDESMCYHTHECQAAKKMSDDKKHIFNVTANSKAEAMQYMENQGYSLCGICGK